MAWVELLLALTDGGASDLAQDSAFRFDQRPFSTPLFSSSDPAETFAFLFECVSVAFLYP